MKKIAIIITLYLITHYAAHAQTNIMGHFQTHFVEDIKNITNQHTPQDIKDMIHVFCKTYQHSKKNEGTAQNPHTKRYDDEVFHMYDASQSLFMKIMCENDNKEKDRYLHYKELKDFGLKCPKANMNGNNCKVGLHQIIHNIYDKIATDIINTMQAQTYGYTVKKGPITDDDVRTHIGKMGYDRSQTLCPVGGDVCIIPITKNIVTQNIKNAQNIHNSNKTLKTINPTEKTQCSNESKKKGLYNIIICAQGVNHASYRSMYNMIQNELLWYTTFASYYLDQIQHNQNIQQAGNQKNNKKQQEYISNIILQNLKTSTETSYKSIEHIAHTKNTYNIHIQLTAYYEITKNIRNKRAAIYTPLHQLYFKMQNVQTQS